MLWYLRLLIRAYVLYFLLLILLNTLFPVFVPPFIFHHIDWISPLNNLWIHITFQLYRNLFVERRKKPFNSNVYNVCIPKIFGQYFAQFFFFFVSFYYYFWHSLGCWPTVSVSSFFIFFFFLDWQAGLTWAQCYFFTLAMGSKPFANTKIQLAPSENFAQQMLQMLENGLLWVLWQFIGQYRWTKLRQLLSWNGEWGKW